MGAYSITYNSRVDAIVMPIAICEAVKLEQNMIVPKIFRSNNALWDTGATNTLISRNVVEHLCLTPYKKAQISDNQGISEVNTYLVHVNLPTKDTVTNLEVLLTENEDHDVIIGMDIINLGNLHFTNSNGESTFSFNI